MATFDFSTLNSNDFEDLIRDLLNSREKQKGGNTFFRSFKEGKDKGIDLLHSTESNQYDIVGQVKHFFRSGYTALFSNLKNIESKKVQKLKPLSYFLATSVDLSVSNVQEIYKLFKPFIKNLSDIYCKRRLN